MFMFLKKSGTSVPDSKFAVGLNRVPLDSDTEEPACNSDHRKFVCPGCNNKTLTIARSIELGADSRDDEYSLQAIACNECDVVGVATYQESRRGAEESWDHLGYKMDKVNYENFLQQLLKCRSPTKAKCSCEAHRIFAVKNEHGTLKPLEKLEFDKPHFLMRFH
jgi:hypothetical protein